MEYQALKWEIRENEQPGGNVHWYADAQSADFLNAVDVRMRVELDILCDEIAHKYKYHVMIITGEGRLSAGGDLKSEAGPLGVGEGISISGISAPTRKSPACFSTICVTKSRSAFKFEDLPRIVIAAINGPAVGIGL